MDRSWIGKSRNSPKYLSRVAEFLKVAIENAGSKNPSQPNDINNVAQEESVLSREDDDGCLQSYEDHVI
ncbi:hypothetical protein Taro_012742 [Colocasia esculenta]|uniref:Uncharacterized protein n=1 Tax=Colocasia esculenta TaxID=4460 RepID=A0A843UGL5_COLES|nr:hypothetical protein [Colocasia esculenta]